MMLLVSFLAYAVISESLQDISTMFGDEVLLVDDGDGVNQVCNNSVFEV